MSFDYNRIIVAGIRTRYPKHRLKEKTGSDLCIAITGVAGPEDIDPERPAGLAYIGITYNGETRVSKVWHRNNGRFWNRNFFVLRMLNEVYQSIK